MLFGCLATLLIPVSLFGQIAKSWEANINASLQSANKAVCIRLDQQKNILLLNYTWLPDSTGDILIVKIDPQGKEVWRRLFDGPLHTDDRPVDLTVDRFDNIWICGTSRTKTGDTDILLLKYSSEGTLLNQELFGWSIGKFDAPTAVAVDRAGFPSISGYVTSNDSGVNYAVLRYYPQGSLMWFRFFTSAEMDMANDISVDDSCNIYSTGIVNGGMHTADIFVQKYDSAGTLKWQHSYDGQQTVNDVATCLTMDDSAAVYISGYVNHAGDRSDIPLLKFNRNGILVREIIFNGGTSDVMAQQVFTTTKTAQVTASFMDYSRQENGSLLIQFNLQEGSTIFNRKSSNGSFYYRLLPEKTYRLLIGSNTNSDDGMLQPTFSIPDSSEGYVYQYTDSTVHGLAYIRDLLVDDHRVYFLGDDAGDSNGTISLFCYAIDVPFTENFIKHIPLKKWKN